MVHGPGRTLKWASDKSFQERLAAVNICFIIMASLFLLYLQGVSNPSLTMKQTINMPTALRDLPSTKMALDTSDNPPKIAPPLSHHSVKLST